MAGVKASLMIQGIFLAALSVGPGWTQELPVAEMGFDYSYARYAPNSAYSTASALNGGGGWITFNINKYVGIRADLQGYSSHLAQINIAPNASFARGLNFTAQGKLFSYVVGPQISMRTHRMQPFGHVLFGGAHSNTYRDAFTLYCNPPGVCAFSAAPASTVYAAKLGGGLDIRANHIVAFRFAEINYLLTGFNNPFTRHSSQHSVQYGVGIVFMLDKYLY